MTEETRAIVAAWELFLRELAKEMRAAHLNLPADEVLVEVADTMRRVSRYPWPPATDREAMN